MNLKALAATAALLSTSVGIAYAQQTAPPTLPTVAASTAPCQHNCNHSLRMARKHLEHMITQLQQDPHDYGGHRVKAIQLLQQGSAELKAALEYEKANGK